MCKDSLKETRKKANGNQIGIKIMLNTFHAPVNMEFIEHENIEHLISTNYFDTDLNSLRAFILSPTSLIKIQKTPRRFTSILNKTT